MLFDPQPSLFTVSRLTTLATLAAFAFISLITAGVLPFGVN